MWRISWVQWECLVHWGIPWWVWGDIMSILGMFSTLGFLYKFNYFPNNLPPHLSWYPPVYSWYPLAYWTPSVLIISPKLMVSPGVLKFPVVLHRQTLCRVLPLGCCKGNFRVEIWKSALKMQKTKIKRSQSFKSFASAVLLQHSENLRRTVSP